MGHLRKRDLEILLGDPPARASQRRGIRQVRHLISGCAECASQAFPSTAEEDAVYDACIDRARQAVQGAEELWREEREKRDHALALVRSKGWDKQTRKERDCFPGGWAAVEVLLAVCFESR